jgi:hypothetical protein
MVGFPTFCIEEIIYNGALSRLMGGSSEIRARNQRAAIGSNVNVFASPPNDLYEA